jgi:hypothetical protein
MIADSIIEVRANRQSGSVVQEARDASGQWVR